MNVYFIAKLYKNIDKDKVFSSFYVNFAENIMDIEHLQQIYARHKSVKALCRAVEHDKNIVLEGLTASATSLAFAALSKLNDTGRTFLFVMDDSESAAYFYHDLTQVMGNEKVLYFPSSFRRAVKHGQKDAGNIVLRTDVLTRLANGIRGLYIVTSPEALAERVISNEELSKKSCALTVGQQIAISEFDKRMFDMGMRRVDYVYEPGDYAVRGSLVDVYSYADELPLRIDFFGDEVDSIRSFEVDTQLSRDRLQKVTLVGKGNANNCETGIPVTEVLPEDTTIVMRSVSEMADRVQLIFEEGFSVSAHIENEARGEEKLPDASRLLISGEELLENICSMPIIQLCSSVSNEKLRKNTDAKCRVIRFSTTPQPIIHKNFELATKLFGEYLTQGYHLYILADSEKQTSRLKAIFDEMQLQESERVVFTPVVKTLHEGFADDDLKICLFTDHQIFDRFHRYSLRSDKAKAGRIALTLKELQQFSIGDYVVHIDHGVGRFGGLIRLPQPDGTSQEVIKISYAHEDTVFVSIHALHKVSKYKGKDGEPPRLSNLGTGAWERMKERTKAHLKDIARDLIKLYGTRIQQHGFAFSPDGYMQNELEASFLYEDTPDQLKATSDVKRDMESHKPMDRLICGDVGFGKTEVAVRAAFKAATDGKQVAVMVPTTVLAYQHFRTFGGRLKDMPVRVDYLSRARSAKQTSAVLKDLADGKIDILIGTHKLLGKTVKFKDLGLLIIDEEQKFGVATKEKLRQMKTNVDTLTLTATPIPRTLQFSLMGARDMSVISTPPPNRYPIQTEVHTFSSEIICDAINFEMSRSGQVYIVNPRVSGLYDLESMIHKYIPDCRIAVGHGKMNPEDLEKIILDFANYEYDVLVSTTIIESGIDIPNANTIIINGANHFGLSDLHQMRGRVGRSNKKAFCYLLAPPLASLPDDARRRLQAIENFAHLGSGIHIAMQDLDIRGAGNLLGAEQSGFIADLGYEAYQKILAEAMRELRKEEAEKKCTDAVLSNGDNEKTSPGGLFQGNDVLGTSLRDGWIDECVLESDLSLYFSESYVPTSSERMLLYRELDNITDDASLERYRERLIDRFGPLPVEAEELLAVSTLKRFGMRFACERLVLKAERMRMFFTDDNTNGFYDSDEFGRVITYASTHVSTTALAEVKGRRMMTIKDVKSVSMAVEILRQILGT